MQRKQMAEVKNAIQTLSQLTQIRTLDQESIQQLDNQSLAGSADVEARQHMAEEHSTIGLDLGTRHAMRLERTYIGSVEIRRTMKTTRLANIHGHQADSQKGVDETRITVQLPTWLLPRRYQFRMTRIYTGWEYSIRSIPILPSHSPIFKLCRKGDIPAVQRLF
jgi:hypothetical protein